MPLGINGGGPAPGFRYDISGALAASGSNGYSWASTINSTNGIMHLHFNATALYPSNAYHRAFGFQLRCLSE
ncbi:hypothetical protein [uncultured Rikenella sp.]|uniref:hypothetical protein n=1 Tax=uncultured Rikenella sp. TaxID=368003 RepID=UPI0025F4BEC8|nr:hypothetical protein [uncultured Rikenella sp.]